MDSSTATPVLYAGIDLEKEDQTMTKCFLRKNDRFQLRNILALFRQKIPISQSQPLLQPHLGLPAQAVEARAVHPLARSAVGLGGVKGQLAGKAHHLGNGLRHLGDRHVVAATDVDVAQHGLGVLRIHRLGQVHHMHAGGGHVVYIQKLSLGRAAAPNGDAACTRQLGLVQAANQGGNDVGIFWVVVVAWAIQVGGHDAAVVNTVAGAVLAVVAFAKLDASDLGNGIGLVGGFQSAGEQSVFAHGLRRQLGVNATRAQEQKLFHAHRKRGLHHVGLNHQVVVNKVSRVGVVGMNAAYAGCGQIHLGGFF